MSKTLICQADKAELDQYIDKMAEPFMELVAKLKELKLDLNAEWIQTIHTILDSGANGVHKLAFFNNDQEYPKWCDHYLEVCEDEEIEICLTYENGHTETIKALYNRAANTYSEDGEFDLENLVSTTFEYNGEIKTICPTCFDCVLEDGKCTNGCE